MSRPRLRVNCYKESGKWAYSNTNENEHGVEVNCSLYPIINDFTGDTPIFIVRTTQEEAVYRLNNLIKKNCPTVKYLSPEKFGFDKEYIYVIELMLQDHQCGFCHFIMDKTKNNIEMRQIITVTEPNGDIFHRFKNEEK